MNRARIDPTAPLTAQVRHLAQRGTASAGTRLYRFFAGEQLVYVGVTSWIPERWQAHKKRADWWHLVDSVVVSDPFPHMAAALQAEVAAIKSEHPTHNRRSVIWQGNGRAQHREHSVNGARGDA